ncbi:ABC transporter ATP-binding protein [Shimia thalassica]|uniref:ABC transporter ATP-binding protein n=1 Tax=Shimia thalassica TaxID=1715693 RepID=UPI001C096B54|nr:ABC transporter ATP-binding protein [Shimia thalassica]MBU2941532.1 ABC transporter ATP-binding protein [Shimia thalassica]MDO6504087.1 ABC transporter ATP-binding protein [Shimia thalassica]MDO6522184.1 ABC transporter ATP-binding protein [Shimia thalassica]MDO6799218.1 ABC transporter ATP-binding protein [Shimia thalassica]
MTTLLETRHLEMKFGAVYAARDVNITINEGEILGVIGSNGAGKTTFVNMVTGYLSPTSGDIIYRGNKITGKATRDITRLGICRSFQIPQLFPELPVLENMLIALTIAKQEKPSLFRPAIDRALEDEAHELLSHFDIDQYADQLIQTLPQGVRKLVDIAMATVAKPDLLFLDEPTSGVSADEKMEFMRVLIAALKTTKTAVLFIEHDMEIVEEFSPRCVAFYEGTILADGPTGEVLQDDKVREFVIGSEFHRTPTDAAPKEGTQQC